MSMRSVLFSMGVAATSLTLLALQGAGVVKLPVPQIAIPAVSYPLIIVVAMVAIFWKRKNGRQAY